MYFFIIKLIPWHLILLISVLLVWLMELWPGETDPMSVGLLAKMGFRSHTTVSEMEREVELERGKGNKRDGESEIAWQFLTRSLFKFCSHERTHHPLVLLNLMKQNMFIKLCLYFSSVLSKHLFLVRKAGGKSKSRGISVFPVGFPDCLMCSDILLDK